MSFDQFWACFPRRVAKIAAKKAYDKALKQTTHQEIMAGVERYAFHTRNTEHQYIKHPASWLNAGCWEDELTDNRKLTPQSVGSVFGNLAAQMERDNGVRSLQGNEGPRASIPSLPFTFEE